MIVYKRKEKELVIPCGLGSVVCIDPGYELQSKSVDPSTEVIDVIADASFYGLRNVTVNQVTADIDPDIQPENIKRDVEILGVTGTFDGGTLQDKMVDSSTSGQVITPDGSNYGLGSVTVNPYVLDSKTVDPSTSQITVTSDADGLSSVTVNAAPLQNRTVDPSTVQLDVQRTLNDYYGLRHVYINPVTAAIDSDIQPENIKRDVEILGVTGTFDGGPLQSKNVDSSTVSQTVTPDGSNYGLSSVTVNPYTVESVTVKASVGKQVITPTNANALSSVTVQPAYLQDRKVSASTVQKKVSTTAPSTYYGLGTVTISAVTADIDPYIQAGNIKRGVEILGVEGTFDGGTLQDKSVNSSTSLQVLTADPSYYGLGEVTINPYTVESKINTIVQNGHYVFTPTNADALSSVTVDVSTETYRVQRDASANLAGRWMSGPIFNLIPLPGFDAMDHVVLNAPLTSVTVSPSADHDVEAYITEYPTAYGFHSLHVRQVTSNIDSNIQPENIKEGVTILGVTGTYEGTSIPPDYDTIYNALLEI